MNESQVIPPPADDAGALVPSANRSMEGVSHNTASAMAQMRSETEVQYFMARRFPRDEVTAAAKIKKACARPRMADDAFYTFKRGDGEVTGPSVYLARMAASQWGNLRSGIRILERTATETLIQGFCTDLESNREVSAQSRIRNLIQRKVWVGDTQQTKWVEPDERDYTELVNRVGAKLERNCILQVLPSDVIEEALGQARATLEAAVKGELTINREDMIAAVVSAFHDYGISRAVLEAKIQAPISAASEKDIVNLRSIFKSVKAGESTMAEHFDLKAAVKPAGAASRAKDAIKNAPKPEGATASDEKQ